MGRKGDKLTQDSVIVAEVFTEKLQSIEGITSKKMFGGHGIFHEGKMFGIIDSQGQCYLKTDDSNRADFEASGSHKHGRMPYFSIPDTVFNDQDELISWVKISIAIVK